MGPGRSRPIAYVFDFDGTLGSIPVDWDRVKMDLREVIGSKEELQSVFPTIVRIMNDDPKLIRRAFALLDRYEEEALPSAFLYPGSFELLKTLAETAKISLVTMQGSRAADMLLRRLELKQFLVHTFTREDALDRGEQVRLALDAMGVEKESSLFVGDRLNDLNAAKRIGVPFVMMRTHGSDPVEADVAVYHSVAEFLETLRR